MNIDNCSRNFILTMLFGSFSIPAVRFHQYFLGGLKVYQPINSKIKWVVNSFCIFSFLSTIDDDSFISTENQINVNEGYHKREKSIYPLLPPFLSQMVPYPFCITTFRYKSIINIFPNAFPSNTIENVLTRFNWSFKCTNTKKKLKITSRILHEIE